MVYRYRSHNLLSSVPGIGNSASTQEGKAVKRTVEYRSPALKCEDMRLNNASPVS